MGCADLYRAIQSANSDRAEGRECVPQEWIDQATAFLQTYRPKVDAISRQIGLCSIEISERDEAAAALRAWLDKTKTVIRMALKGQRQLLEMLGLRSRRR